MLFEAATGPQQQSRFDLRFRRPQGRFRKALDDNGLHHQASRLGATQEHEAGCNRPCASPSGTFDSAICSIVEAWPSLPVHVKEAIKTLVDSATAG